MSGLIVLWLGIGGVNAETLTCAGATLSLTSCNDGEVNIDCGDQTSCKVKAELELTSGSCVVQRVEGGSCEVTVVASDSTSPPFSVKTTSGQDAVLTLRNIQPQCGNLPFVFVEPIEDAGKTKVTLEGLRATTACSKNGPLLATSNSSGTPTIVVSITDSVLTGWTSLGWESSDFDSTNEGGLISLDNTTLTLTKSVLADNTLNTADTQTGGGFISAAGAGSSVTLSDNLFVLSKATPQDIQGSMLRFAAGAQATLSNNLFIDNAGVTADYAPLIQLVGETDAVTLNHNLFYGVGSTLPIGSLDEAIPTLNHNLFLGLTTPWDIPRTASTGDPFFNPEGANNWAQSGVTDDVGGPLTLGDLQLLTLTELWADLHPGEATPTSSVLSDYDGVDLTTLALWPDSCGPLLDLDPVPGVLGDGGSELWAPPLDATTTYAVSWYCSVVEDDGTLCFEESADHCAARTNGDTCKTTFITGEDECEPTGTDSGSDDTSKPDDTDDSGDPEVVNFLAGSQQTTFMKVYEANCSATPNRQGAVITVVAALAFASRRRRHRRRD